MSNQKIHIDLMLTNLIFTIRIQFTLRMEIQISLNLPLQKARIKVDNCQMSMYQ